MNEAALLAARREKNAVSMEELEEAIDRATAGLERKSRVVSDSQKERVAVHEMGHALVALKSRRSIPCTASRSSRGARRRSASR